MGDMKDKVYWVIKSEKSKEYFAGYYPNTKEPQFINDLNQAGLCLTKEYALKGKKELYLYGCGKLRIIPVKRDTTIVEM